MSNGTKRSCVFATTMSKTLGGVRPFFAATVSRYGRQGNLDQAAPRGANYRSAVLRLFVIGSANLQIPFLGSAPLHPIVWPLSQPHSGSTAVLVDEECYRFVRVDDRDNSSPFIGARPMPARFRIRSAFGTSARAARSVM
jgi:hypothetical protein